MLATSFESGLAAKIDQTFRANSHLRDHRREFPWWTGSLGNPNAGIWFLAERPSDFRLRQVAKRPGFVASPELQWAISNGDMLFRKALVAAGFKSGELTSEGGWNCYITNLIKDCGKIGKKRDRLPRAMIWSEVLQWELSTSKPRLVVVMGDAVAELFPQVLAERGVPAPHVIPVPSYTYVASKPERTLKGTRRPGHPQRIEEYVRTFQRIRTEFDKQEL